MATTGLLSLVAAPRSFHAETIDDCYLVGEGPAIQKIRSQLQRIAPYVRMALIVGEAGTGKRFIARHLHDRSAGGSGPFITKQATTFIEGLSSSTSRIEALREAHGGTLFLNGICSLSTAAQSRLLRLLYLHEETRAQRCDLRIIGSSLRDLRTLSAAGLFHEELYRRIAAVEITLPPLRKRLDDLPFIVEALLRHIPEARAITPHALSNLYKHSWTVNIRELQAVLTKAAHLACGASIEPADLSLLPIEAPTAPAKAHHLDRLQDVVQRHVLDVLTHCSGNKLRASEVLGISRSTLYRMLDTCAVTADLR